ncbi:PTS system, mannose-specific IIB component / PTS system, mannose-specific IIC component / PTS system, mannose-specific IIA component [Corynebacterium casei]|uniref:PTS system mannose-specific transporter subunits IIBCA n=2 Tax=Corynebacterium casei TaxID=160386 RepID=A0ABN4CEG0_9CORY|nr:PTS system mannose-specific transporter subunits IIBCA [Corynebacterium casei LMG S-19264]SLM92678.1 PTS system, mannose-specific IIB component / PTS system, mannose-specific IIC component / PTS system, mannose-specific IIA component [Corynebacterium casei]
MAAENLEAAAAKLGYDIKIETHGSIGVEGHFTPEDIKKADTIVIGADTVINKERFIGKRLVATGVDEAIKSPKELINKALNASTFTQEANAEASDEEESSNPGFGTTLYKALMNGVSHMIPFVVTGGLLLALSLSIGGTASAEGLVIPEDSPWMIISQIGELAFSLMVPVLSGYIAVGIADRPGLAPGLITGLIAVNGDLYGSEANAGFIGGIVTGILSGYIALAIKKVPVHKFVAPIWPIIIIPIITTLVVGLLFVYLIGAPIASLFDALTVALSGMQGTSTLFLGALLGAMVAFDMGGPFNKTAFLFGGGLIAAGNPLPMGMVATAIAVPPIAVGVATLLRRAWFNKAENDPGIAALFMGFFGITEGAIPLAAARPLQVIPANVVGGASPVHWPACSALPITSCTAAPSSPSSARWTMSSDSSSP